MRTIAIVVTYNRKELLQECIKSLQHQKNKKLDILIIDNASTDGTKELISSKFSDVIYFNTGSNLGGAGGFNYGIKKAFELEKKYDYLWIMDDDTIPDNNVLSEFLSYAKKDSDFGFLTPKTVWTDKSFCLMNIQTDMHGKLINKNTPNFTRVSKATFVSCFINAKAVLEVGLPIKEFFIWGDDTEYTLRISGKFPCYYINSCKVTHKMAVNNSASISTDVSTRIDRYVYSYRNRFYIAKKRGLRKVIRYHLSILKAFLQIIMRSKNYRLKRMATICKGYIAGISFSPSIEKIKNSN